MNENTTIATVLASRTKIVYFGREDVYHAVNFGFQDKDPQRLADRVTEFYNVHEEEDEEVELQEDEAEAREEDRDYDEEFSGSRGGYPFDDDDLIDGVGFADPGGKSSLRAATRNNPRDQSCPTCKRKNVLTRIDRQRGYQCDHCADRAESGCDY